MGIENLRDAKRELGITNLDWDALGEYVYAYFEPADWRDRIEQYQMENGGDDRVAPLSPSPFYVGIGRSDRAVSHIREALQHRDDPSMKHAQILRLLDEDSVPDIRILAHGLNSGVAGISTRVVETVLISLYGREPKEGSVDEFERRMGYPGALTNKSGSSTQVRAGALASVAATLRKDRRELASLHDIIAELQESTGVETWITIGISGSFDPRANIDQLKSITCSWWPGRSIPDGPFGVIGVSKDSLTRARSLSGSRKELQVPVIRSVYLVNDDYRSNPDDKVSFVNEARFDARIWNAYVGKRLNVSMHQLQGQKMQPMNITPGSCIDGDSLEFSGETSSADESESSVPSVVDAGSVRK